MKNHLNHLTPTAALVRNPNLFFPKVDDEVVMMDETQGRYFGLNNALIKPMLHNACLDWPQ